MTPHLSTPRRPLRAARRGEAGWVLAASLILATMVTAVTITYARHALLAKQTLQYAKGATEVDEASQSELERVRQLMREGNKPGTIATGTHDAAVTSTGQQVQGERQVTGQATRDLRTQAQGKGSKETEQAKVLATAKVVPGNSSSGSRTTLPCSTGDVVLAGNLTIISGPVSYVGVEMAGLFLLEADAELTLQDVVLHGTILTRNGVCPDNLPQAGSHRPVLRVYGGLKQLSGTELPDVAMCGPDMVVEADANSRVDVQGFVSADEVHINGRGSMHGMVVHNESEEFGAKMRRPGHGRGPQSWPAAVDPGAEEVTSLAFPAGTVPASVIAAMENASIN